MQQICKICNKICKICHIKNISSLSQNNQNMQQICKICKSKFNMQNMHSPLCWLGCLGYIANVPGGNLPGPDSPGYGPKPDTTGQVLLDSHDSLSTALRYHRDPGRDQLELPSQASESLSFLVPWPWLRLVSWSSCQWSTEFHWQCLDPMIFIRLGWHPSPSPATDDPIIMTQSLRWRMILMVYPHW
jgi:hypothetical protein